MKQTIGWKIRASGAAHNGAPAAHRQHFPKKLRELSSRRKR